MTERLNTEAKNMWESTQVNSERAVPNRRGLDCSHGAVFWVVFGQSSCLCPYLAWLRDPFWYACISLSQDGAQHGFHEVGRIYRAWQLLPPLAPYLLWGPVLHVCGLRNPLDHKNEKNMITLSLTQSVLGSCWSLSQGSAGDWVQLLSLGSIYLPPRIESP